MVDASLTRILILLVCGSLLQSKVVVAQESPCPNFFRYHRDRSTKELMAIIEIPPPPNEDAFFLKVTLSIAVPLPTRYVGRIELAQNKNEVLQSIKRGESLIYKVHFPLQRPVPLLTSLYFNGVLLCHGPPAFGALTTAIYLEHSCILSSTDSSTKTLITVTETPPSTLTSFQIIQSIKTQTEPSTILTSSTVPEINSTQFIETTVSTTNGTGVKKIINSTIYEEEPPKTDDKIQEFSKLEACGTVDEFRPLINEKKTLLSTIEWPWLAVIYLKKKDDFEFQCLGTLISDRHVVTVAYCIHFLLHDDQSKTILVSLGRTQLNFLSDKQSTNTQVVEIAMHPNNNFRTVDSDLAILVLMERLQLGPRIRPVCLWTGTTSLEKLIGRRGYVAAWNKDSDENRINGTMVLHKVPIVSQEVCLQSNHTISGFKLLNQTFCAGKKNCMESHSGQSGMGFVMYNHYTKRYHLRGVASPPALNQKHFSCDLSPYIFFVDVAKYSNWICEKIEQTAELDDGMYIR